MGVRHVTPWGLWPSGDSRPIAVLPFDAPELTRGYGLVWQEGIDDLGRFLIAAIELAGGVQAWLIRHDTDPNPGTVVQVDAAADVAEAQSRLADAMKLDLRDLLWLSPARMVRLS